MALREGMTQLVAELRLMTETLTPDDVWTDDQLQEELDKTQTMYFRLPLRLKSIYSAGNYIDKLYFFPTTLKWVERYETDDAFRVTDSTGMPVLQGALDDDYQPNYVAGYIEFNSDQDGASYYLDCRGYDLNRAAANIWLRKAGLLKSNVRWKADNHTIHDEQEYEHCMEQYQIYAGKSLGVRRWVRVDEA